MDKDDDTTRAARQIIRQTKLRARARRIEAAKAKLEAIDKDEQIPF